jgi:uncharacterized membrane protein (DUF2068 family)
VSDALVPRPKTVLIVAAFLFIAAVIAAAVSTSLLFPNRVLERLWQLNPSAAPLFHSLGGIAGLLLLALGVVTFIAARGLLHRQRWAWWFAVLLFAVNGLGDVVSFFATGDVLRSMSGVAIAAAFLYALTRAPVRQYFSQQAVILSKDDGA